VRLLQIEGAAATSRLLLFYNIQVLCGLSRVDRFLRLWGSSFYTRGQRGFGNFATLSGQ
jgi:hypothetical protein